MKKEFYIHPMSLAISNLSLLLLIGLIDAKRVTSFWDLVSIIFGGLSSFIFILAIILTHKLKQVYMDPDKVDMIITTGIYKILRHPVYSGIIYMNLGFFFFFRSLFLIPFIIIFSIIWYYEAKYEEKILIKKFKKKYKNYIKKTGMFFPKFF